MYLSRLVTYILLVSAMVFWGMSFIWAKIVFQSFHPFTVMVGRLLISSCFLIVWDYWQTRELSIKWEYLKIFALLAFFQPFLYFVGESYGLFYVSSTVAAIIIATIPVVTPLFTYLFLKERLTVIGLLGLLVSFIGVLLVVLNSNSSLVISLKGILFLIFAVLASIAYVVAFKKMSHRYRGVTILKYQNLLGTLYFLPFAYFLERDSFFLSKVTFDVLINLLLLAGFASTLAFLFFNKAIKDLGVNKTNAFTNTIPIFTAIFAWIILGERIDMQTIVGVLIVITGVLLAQVKSPFFLKNKIHTI